jgi:hypothetical protein
VLRADENGSQAGWVAGTKHIPKWRAVSKALGFLLLLDFPLDSRLTAAARTSLAIAAENVVRILRFVLKSAPAHVR